MTAVTANTLGWEFVPSHDNGFGFAEPEKWIDLDGETWRPSGIGDLLEKEGE